MSRTTRARHQKPKPRMTRSGREYDTYRTRSLEGTGTGGDWQKADLKIRGTDWNQGEIGHGGPPAFRARLRIAKRLGRRTERQRGKLETRKASDG